MHPECEPELSPRPESLERLESLARKVTDTGQTSRSCSTGFLVDGLPDAGVFIHRGLVEGNDLIPDDDPDYGWIKGDENAGHVIEITDGVSTAIYRLRDGKLSYYRSLGDPMHEDFWEDCKPGDEKWGRQLQEAEEKRKREYDSRQLEVQLGLNLLGNEKANELASLIAKLTREKKLGDSDWMTLSEELEANYSVPGCGEQVSSEAAGKLEASINKALKGRPERAGRRKRLYLNGADDTLTVSIDENDGAVYLNRKSKDWDRRVRTEESFLLRGSGNSSHRLSQRRFTSSDDPAIKDNSESNAEAIRAFELEQGVSVDTATDEHARTFISLMKQGQ